MTLLARTYLLALLLLAFGLRAHDVDFGLPANYHPDEVPATEQVARAVRSGHFMLRSYYHPPLLRTLAWLVSDSLQSVWPLRDLELKTRVTAIMRWISVFAGTLAVAVVFVVGRRFLSPPWALFAATLFATSPIVVFQAKYGVPDTLMCMLLLGCWWTALRLYEQPTIELYGLGGCLLGLAVGAKYNAVFAVFSLVTAHALTHAKKRPSLASASAAFAGGAMLGLALGFPLLPVEWHDFLRTTLLEADHQFARGHRGIKVYGSDYWYAFHFVKSVWPATGAALLAAIVVGLVQFAVQQGREKWILLAAAIPYYLAMEQVLKLTFSPERYVLPLMPVYFIAAASLCAAAINRIAPEGRKRVSLACALAAVLAAPPAYRTVRLLATMEPDTRARTSAWMLANVPHDASVAIGGLVYFYPPLSPQQFPNLTQFGRTPAEYSVVSSFDYDEAFAYPTQTASAYQFYVDMFTSQDLVFEAAPPYEAYMFHNPTLRVYRRRPLASAHE